MQREIFALFGVCLAATVGELLLPPRVSATTKKLLRFLVSLILLLLILAPFAGIMQSFSDFFNGEITLEEESDTDYEQVFNDALQAQSALDLREGLYDLLEKRYDMAREDCDIRIVLDGEGALLSVSLYLSGAALLEDPLLLERELARQLNCTVEVR